MRFKIDENLPVEAGELLRSAGHDVATVIDQSLAGEPDEGISEVCRREGRALVTLDMDFADVRAFRPEEHFGIIVLRLRKQSKPRILGIIGRLTPLLSQEPVRGRLWQVGEKRVRIRGGD